MIDPGELPAELRERVEVLRVLGRGSFGEVFEVRVAGSQELLALKVLTSEVDMARVSRELEASGRVRHPHLLTVHGYGTDDQRGWLLMERADGTLTELLRDRGRVAEAWEACRQVAAGLAALHAEGIVHRDLKPENILMVGEKAKIGDLGLAKGGGLQTLTATGLVMGTPSFMAPEQIRGERLTPAVDVFAFGVLLYRVATGRMPYTSEDVRHLLPVLTRGGPVPAGVPLGGCPEVVRACLDPDPARRPTAAELSRGLGPAPRAEPWPGDPKAATRVLTSPGLLRPSDPPVTPVKGVAARNMAMAGGRNVLGVVVVAGLVVGFLRFLQPRLPVPAPPAATPAASTAATVADPAWPAPLGEDFVEEVREELRRAQASFLDPAGHLHDLDDLVDGVPEGWRPLLDADPGRWHLVVQHSQGLQRWYAWIAAGGAFWELTPEQQRQLAELDELYVGERQTPPFRPWLGLAPAEGPPEPFLIRERDGTVLIQGEFTGWTATALDRMRAALAIRAECEEQYRAYFDGRPSPFPGAELEPLGLRDVYQMRRSSADMFLRDLEHFTTQPKWRVALHPWLRPMGTELAATLAAIRRAVATEPETAARLPYTLNQHFEDLRGGHLAGYWSLDFDVLVGGDEDRVLSDVLRAMVWDHWGRTQSDFAIGRPHGFADRRAELWAEVLQAPDVARVRPESWFPWAARFGILHGARVGRNLQELMETRRRFREELEKLSPLGRADVDGGIAYAAVKADPPPSPEQAREILARYRALDPEALAVSSELFRGLEPRLEELARDAP